MARTRRLAIVDGVRTPFCRAGTLLARASAVDLGRAALQALFARTGFDPGALDEVILGCVGQPVDAPNLARVVALRSGVPERVPAATVQRNCASGLEALTRAADAVAAGRGTAFAVGGVESMSGAPVLFSDGFASALGRFARAKDWTGRAAAVAALRPRDFVPRPALRLALADPVAGMGMGDTAELLARECGISREAQDAFALRSHRRAAVALHRHAEEIAPVFVPPDFREAVTVDNGPRPAQSIEALARLRPVFDPEFGTVTAGNSSQISDGAVALLVMEEQRAARERLEPLGFLLDGAYAGCDPARMGLGPVHAVARAEETTGLRLEDAAVVELNEAFAAQALAVLDRMRSPSFARTVLGRERPLGEIPDDRLNPNGGAIALGHPVGATGARLVLTALRELRRRGGGRALVTLCVGGGQGAAVWLEAA